ncbi:MAG: peptidylprolyl isomerase [Gammaproteobacteria bacterium]|jgi:peptidyl-prolyl cis-trans isomerase SurA
MVKLRIVTCVLILLNMVVCNISYAKQPLNKIAATVGNDIITTSELSNKTNLIINNLSKQNISLPPRKILEHQVLNKIILDKIQLQMAQQLAITVDSTSVNQTIEDLAKQEHSTIAEYKQKIQAEGIKFEDFREHIKTELTISRLQQREISNEIRISNADIDGYLNSPAGQDNSGTEYNLGHILIIAPEQPTPAALKKAEIKATNLVNELKKGKDFKQIAMANSADMRALDGGDLGWRQLNEIPTIFVKHVPNMQINEIIGPIQSASGFHIIKLYNKRSGKKADYSELRVRQILIKPSNNTSEQEAKTILSTLRKQITQGQDFAKLAEKRSEELQTAVKGGDLGWITEASVIPEFWDNIIKLPIGEVSEPFKTELGWHLVQVTERRNADHSKDALRNRATEILRERKFNEMLEIWLKKIRDEAKVDVLL